VATGKLKWFNSDKGYGFIEREGDKDVFLHAKVLDAAGINGKTLVDGTRLSFDVKEDTKGAKAVNVSLAA